MRRAGATRCMKENRLAAATDQGTRLVKKKNLQKKRRVHRQILAETL